ncbi:MULTISPECIES: flagellin [unclassified Bradyrhizobium]|uniref:flagellin N-terminal helical domain-containing protein n=1 Tax=unclassified Bradyrhizobium TaxID=2631580 RepID=UPI001BA774CE|nr:MULTISPECIES: flagellin [unclassified Bradyrhizobium]MBR1207852.1 flagellar protein [Bradyrhizobium sp. AUGA SZCCT0124]MBR1316392.1 flagellar protein [Bradyrhizobium sp. AUGA SZCCT0051]MBR1344402.1 flagellar protein [Bradyrhizobium sp. AUGA SZCCT0105]MBR1359413.1 flagellar protein [Bradyrhizobium sp. AUGA SZCCT0045]
MSGIVLSSSVRQNLLSLQSTADLLATTQNRLSTGKKVNTALDNPTNFFTAQSLDNRASDINNLLDGIGNGVQVLQAANTGITSLQKLVDSAKSVANQALQAAVGYSQKSQVTTAVVTGATTDDIRGTATYSNATLAGTVVNNNLTVPAPITAATKLVTAANSDSLAATPTGTISVNGKSITFSNTQTTSTTDSSGNVTLGTGAGSTLTVGDLLTAIDGITGTATASTVAAGALQISTGTNQDLNISGSGLAAFGLTAGTKARTVATPSPLDGLTLTIGATGNGKATNITFGSGAGQVKSLNDLNNALSANNLQASLSAGGALTISTTNDAASATIGTIGGTAAGAGKLFNALVGSAPVQDPNGLANRANLVNQYNNILDQITTTAQDASYNGINLLNGDQLKLTFNETGSSTLKIQGVTFDASGLNLTKLTAGTDFIDNASANATLKTLNSASGLLRTQASTLGSNLSIVQIRQDFSKNLINVLQTGSSNLTLADTNEEAANSQALSTRQSIAVSALALANQSQQSVLQLLR